MKQWFKALHRKLLPQRSDVGWVPYMWLVYLLALIIPWYTGSFDSWGHAAHAIAVPLFLVLYFRGYWVEGGSLVLVISSIIAIGILLSLVNSGSVIFFIYGAAFCSRFRNARHGVITLLIILGVTSIYLSILDLHWMTAFFGTIMTALIGVINLYYAEMGRKNQMLKLSQEEVRHLATVAERERIARDLHDLLGHTLSVITLKSELASKLVARDPERATHEIKDVEDISRRALKQVRQAVAGYRDSGLAGEVANVKQGLEVLGIALHFQPPAVDFSPKSEAVLAMVLREAVTNIIRHSQATRCAISFSVQGPNLEMIVEDNGVGGPLNEGGGLTGMRERLASIGGSLQLESQDGVQLKAIVPIELSQSIGAQDDTCSNR